MTQTQQNKNPPQEAPWVLGDLVETMFDTGAMGAQVLYGTIVKPSGLKRVSIRWESGLYNRVVNGRFGITRARNQDEAARAMARAC